MLKSLYSGVSGLSVNQSSMDVIGNNIANVNTIGFKHSRAIFQDLMSQTLVGGKTPTDSRGGINPRQVGSGAYLAAVDNIFSNGIIKGTQKITDLAVQGDGMFVMRGEGMNEYFYTRAGDFNFDRSQTLTNPSGYKVQGWMADPDTGVVRKDGGVTDIVLGTAYQVMKPKASSEINFAGTLNTTAKASILKYPQFLTQATAQQKMSTLKAEDGTALDLGTNEKVTIKAHATGKTFMSELYNASGYGMGLSNDSLVTFHIGTTPYTLKYKAIDTGVANDGNFNTVESFIDEVNYMLASASTTGTPLGKMSIVNGKFQITGNSSFDITQITSSSNLASLLSPLVNAYGAGYSKESSEAFFQKDVTSSENFNNLSELGVQIQNALNGSVVTNGFNVEFLDNNFGLREGEGITFDGITYTPLGGTATAIPPFTFAYTASDTPDAAATPPQFHTIQELAGLLTKTINDASGGAVSLTFGVINNQIKLTYQTGGDVQFGPISSLAAPGGTLIPNPYLENLLGKLEGQVIGNANKTLITDEIAGKGRLAYNYAKTPTNSVTVNLPTELGMTAGDTMTFSYEVGGVTTNFTYTYAAGHTLTDVITTINANLPAGVTAAPNATDNGLVFTNTTGTPLKFTGVSDTTALGNALNNALRNRTVNATIAGVDGTLGTGIIDVKPIESITGLSIRKASTGEVFNNNMLMENNISLGSSITSKRFLAVASSEALIVNLFGANGASFGFNEQESINFNGSVGGTKVTNNDVFNIGSSSTVQNMMDAMENYLGLGPDHSFLKNVVLVDGKIQVTGEKGQSNNIDFLTLSSPLSKNAAFNNAMSAYQIVQSASGGYEATSIDVFDEQGNKHVLNFKFSLFNEERNEWRMSVETNDPSNRVSINGATSNELIMKFNSDGTLAYLFDRLTTPNKILVNPTLRFSAANGTNTLDNIALNLGTQGSNDGMSLAAGTGGFRQNSSNGYAMGELKERMFNPAGELVGTYTNGQIRTLAQISLATFTNLQGLLKVGDTMFAETGSSGQATLGQAQTGGRGDISASSLENSNVDISQELVSMITTQRGFQANSKVITTSDEMIQEVLNMKR